MDNGAVHVVSTIIHNVMSSEADDEIAELYLNTKYRVGIRNLLEELFHPQTETPLQTYNYTSEGKVNITIAQICSNVMGTSFYFLLNWENQKQCKVYWSPGSQNIG